MGKRTFMFKRIPETKRQKLETTDMGVHLRPEGSSFKKTPTKIKIKEAGAYKYLIKSREPAPPGPLMRPAVGVPIN